MSDDYQKLEELGIDANKLTLLALQGIAFQIAEQLARRGEKALVHPQCIALQRQRDALLQYIAQR